ncbi:peptidase M14 [Xylophilus sp. Kf1]|nr:peptidase M14 [Xylophilus sp. Kf1]
MNILLELTLPRTLDTWVAELLAQRPRGRVEGWLFEGPQARRAAERRLAEAGVKARFFSAYKPLVFHFLEEVELPGLRRVTVRYPLHPKASPRRFALEAYPLADLLAGVDFALLPQPLPTDKPIYEVELEWQDGRHRTDHVFAPNHLHLDPIGETLLSPTAWLQDLPRECDHQEVFRRIVDCVQQHDWPAGEPYFERLDLQVELPGVRHHPEDETGWIDSHEALHEDLYFSLLEVFQRRSGRPTGDRRLQPGQIVPDVRHSDTTVHLRVSTRPYPAADAASPAADTAQPARSDPLADALAPLSADAIAQAFARIGGLAFEATSRQGRPVRGVYRAGAAPAVIVSGGQHANESSGVVGALRAGEWLAAQAESHFALIPLENPDGHALHRELCGHAPRHMHHAARYTALGDDLEYRETAPLYESRARQQALALSGATLHINLHGYPAHEWTRPMSGYIPRGFDLWTVPKGFFLIVRHHAGWGARARRLLEQVCFALSENAALMAFNERQRASYRTHAGEPGFEILHGTACTVAEVNRPGAPITLITEFPDETVYGEAFRLAHDTQTATVLAAVEALKSLQESAD